MNEELRKEINELRERVANLELQVERLWAVRSMTTRVPSHAQSPYPNDPYTPPFTDTKFTGA